MTNISNVFVYSVREQLAVLWRLLTIWLASPGVARLRHNNADYPTGDAARIDHTGTGVVGCTALRPRGSIHACTRSIKGSMVISFKTVKPGRRMQIDLQSPLNITKVVHNGTDLKYEREGNVFWVTFDREIAQGVEDKVHLFYEGIPKAARNPPWDGGVTWGRDDLGDWFINRHSGYSASICGLTGHRYDEPTAE